MNLINNKIMVTTVSLVLLAGCHGQRKTASVITIYLNDKWEFVDMEKQREFIEDADKYKKMNAIEQLLTAKPKEPAGVIGSEALTLAIGDNIFDIKSGKTSIPVNAVIGDEIKIIGKYDSVIIGRYKGEDIAISLTEPRKILIGK